MLAGVFSKDVVANVVSCGDTARQRVSASMDQVLLAGILNQIVLNDKGAAARNRNERRTADIDVVSVDHVIDDRGALPGKSIRNAKQTDRLQTICPDLKGVVLDNWIVRVGGLNLPPALQRKIPAADDDIASGNQKCMVGAITRHTRWKRSRSSVSCTIWFRPHSPPRSPRPQRSRQDERGICSKGSEIALSGLGRVVFRQLTALSPASRFHTEPELLR